MDPLIEHARKRQKLAAELAAARACGTGVGLRKSTSNLFRQRDQTGVQKIDVRRFSSVLQIDRERRIADVEGMTTYAALADATLRHGLLPAVVPELKTITAGGAVAGLGIESSSFRFGLVHETIDEMEILLGDGSIVHCSPGENQDLFYGFPNSYGTLGYALRVKMRLIPAARHVHLTHSRFTDPSAYFAQIATSSKDTTLDYLDGTVFGRDEMYLTAGRFRDDAPYASDYTYMKIYYRSIREKVEDWLTARGYVWRWDTDWFWCSKHFHVQQSAVRFLATPWALNSRTYHRLTRLSHRVLPNSTGAESVIQDVDIPIERAVEFLDFLLAEIGITPIWICPFRSCRSNQAWDLYALDPDKIHINFGFWDTVQTSCPPGCLNRKVESKALELGGKKALYSTSYYDEETFWTIYNKERYQALKRKYDPEGVFLDLYEKCVLRK